MALTENRLRTLKPKDKSYKVADHRGLYIEVTPSGGKAPALALDFMVFTLADADQHDWRAKRASTLVGTVVAGPVCGFEAKDAPATVAMAEFVGSLDETWRSGETEVDRFRQYRALSDEARSAWLGHVVSRTIVASLAFGRERSVPLHETLASLLEIEAAHWWRPTAANFFDRVPGVHPLTASRSRSP